MRTETIGGHEIPLDIPEGAVITEVVAAVTFQYMKDGKIFTGSQWGINSVPVHHIYGLLEATRYDVLDLMTAEYDEED